MKKNIYTYIYIFFFTKHISVQKINRTFIINYLSIYSKYIIFKIQNFYSIVLHYISYKLKRAKLFKHTERRCYVCSFSYNYADLLISILFVFYYKALYSYII